MHLTTDVARRRLVPIGVSLLVATGTAVGVVLATAGGGPAGTGGPYPPVPSTRPAPRGSAQPVVPGRVPPAEAADAGALSPVQLTAALRAAESRQGLPYVWGAAGPASFDSSGLVQWSFAQAGVAMPRVAADRSRGPCQPA